MEGQHLAIHQDVATQLKVSQPKHVERLARHLFQNNPKALSSVEKYFPSQEFIVSDLKPAPPRNLLFHPPF